MNEDFNALEFCAATLLAVTSTGAILASPTK